MHIYHYFLSKNSNIKLDHYSAPFPTAESFLFLAVLYQIYRFTARSINCFPATFHAFKDTSETKACTRSSPGGTHLPRLRLRLQFIISSSFFCEGSCSASHFVYSHHLIAKFSCCSRTPQLQTPLQDRSHMKPCKLLHTSHRFMISQCSVPAS